MGMMTPVFAGQTILSDIELFEMFNVELSDGSDLWHIMPRWGQDTFIDNFNASATIKDNGRAERIAKYRNLADKNLPLFVEND